MFRKCVEDIIKLKVIKDSGSFKDRAIFQKVLLI